MMDIERAIAIAGAAAVAGAINSIAGGGTLISFPALVALGMDPIVANATNAVALFPGSLASAFAYRRELSRDRNVALRMMPPAGLGGAAGALLLLTTPAKVFNVVIPFLVLFATALLFVQNLRPTKAKGGGGEWMLPKSFAVTFALVFAVGVYGGYFGAAMGIMILAILDRLGGVDINRLNGVKTVTSALINAIAAVAFVGAKKIDLPAAGVMAIGAIAGGAIGGIVARRIKPIVVRWAVVAIGVILSGLLAYRALAR